MSEVIAEAIPGAPLAVLSGPTFAAEVAMDKPTAVTLACNDELIGKVLMETLSSRHFRIYRTRDVIGAQMGGAVKNVLAIACGIVEGRQLGDNTRAALVTRGQGSSLEAVLAERNSVAEGVFTASSVTDLAHRLDVEAPICTAVDAVLNHFADIDTAISGLLSRPLKEETA